MEQRRYEIDRSKVFSKTEVTKLLLRCEEKATLALKRGATTWPKRYMLVHLALCSGLRVSEIQQLSTNDLYLTKTENRIFVSKAKRGKSRHVFIDTNLAKHLKQFLDYKQRTLGQPKDSPLFTGHRGLPISITALQISFKKALEEVGLESHSIHDARHSYATYLLAATNNLRLVQKQLGHSNLDMTALYADVLPEQIQANVESIRQAVGR